MSSIAPRLQAIPSNGESKLFNITDFSGIDNAENPFATSPSSAKDALNLYINDEGTLATRPRLHFKNSYLPTLDISELISIVKHQDEYYIAVYKTSANELKISLFSEHGVVDINLENLNENCSLFENNQGDILLICTTGLFKYNGSTSPPSFEQITEYNGAYIPTLRTGARLSDPNIYIDLEERNALTNKYKIKYFFDPREELDESITINIPDITSLYDNKIFKT